MLVAESADQLQNQEQAFWEIADRTVTEDLIAHNAQGICHHQRQSEQIRKLTTAQHKRRGSDRELHIVGFGSELSKARIKVFHDASCGEASQAIRLQIRNLSARCSKNMR